MTNANDYVLVNGNFTMNSNYYSGSDCSYSSKLSAGILEVKGDITGKDPNSQYNSDKNFYQYGTFKLIMSGDKVQTVDIEKNAYSSFNILDISNSYGVIFINPLVAKELIGWEQIKNTDLTIINSNMTLQDDEFLHGNLTLISNSISLDGYTLIIGGDLNLQSGTLDLDWGELIVDKNFNHSGGTLYVSNADFSVNTDYIMSGSSKLIMNKKYDYIYITGNFSTTSSVDESGYLTNGTFELKGNFNQGGNAYSFACSGSHEVILSGSEVQVVTFANYGKSKFKNINLCLLYTSRCV